MKSRQKSLLLLYLPDHYCTLNDSSNCEFTSATILFSNPDPQHTCVDETLFQWNFFSMKLFSMYHFSMDHFFSIGPTYHIEWHSHFAPRGPVFNSWRSLDCFSWGCYDLLWWQWHEYQFTSMLERPSSNGLTRASAVSKLINHNVKRKAWPKKT